MDDETVLDRLFHSGEQAMIYKRRVLPNPGISTEKLRKFDDDMLRSSNDQDENLATILNKGISFADNFDAYFTTYTSNATPDTEDAVAHELGKIPTGFIVVGLDKGAVVYDGTTTDTKTTIYLKCTVASTAVTILVF